MGQSKGTAIYQNKFRNYSENTLIHKKSFTSGNLSPPTMKPSNRNLIKEVLNRKFYKAWKINTHRVTRRVRFLPDIVELAPKKALEFLPEVVDHDDYPKLTAAYLEKLGQKTGLESSKTVSCGPCWKVGRETEPDGYCQECDEHFCSVCIQQHKAVYMFKNHKIQNRTEMPKEKISTIVVEEVEEKETCDEHPGEVMRFICVDHQLLCCSICATLKHRQCKELVYIPELDAKETSKQCLETMKNLDTIADSFKHVKRETDKVKHNLDELKSKFEEDLQKLHDEIIKILNKVVERLRNELCIVYDSEKQYLNLRTKMCDEAINQIKKTNDEIDKTLKKGNDSKSFLMDKKITMDHIPDYNSLLDDIRLKNVNPLEFEFKNSNNLHELAALMYSMGTLKIKKRPLKTATLLTEVSAKHKGDSYKGCDISGAVELPNGKLVVTDMYNESLKLFDTEYKVVAQYKLLTAPWDVASIKDQKIVVSFPKERRLQYFTANNSFQPGKKIGRYSSFYGVDYHQDKIFVTCPRDKPANVKILDMEGKILKQIGTQPGQNSYFVDPLFIAVRYDGRMIYISDSACNTITGLELKLNGKTVTHEEPKGNLFGGIAPLPDGSIYLCEYNGKKILNFSYDCRYIGDLTEITGEKNSPTSITYCPKQGRLVVFTQRYENFRVYQLT